MVQNPDLLAFYVKAEDLEAYRRLLFFLVMLRNLQSIFYQYSEGLLDEALWQSHRAGLAGLLASPSIR